MVEHDVTIVRSPKSREDPYVRFARETAQDSKLSFGARGLLVYIVSKPAGWRVRHSDLQREGDIGKDALNTLLKELREHGYIERKQARSTGGTFKWTLTVFETPDLNPSFTSAENPVVVKGVTSDGLSIDGKSALVLIKGSRARAPVPSVDHKDLETKDLSKKKTIKKSRKALSKQVVIFRGVTGHLPAEPLRADVDKAIEAEPDIPRMALCYKTWLSRGYLKYGMDWLFSWYVNNSIPERSFRKDDRTKQAERPDDAVRGYAQDTERSVLRKGINEG